jgi:hypothetical protein
MMLLLLLPVMMVVMIMLLLLMTVVIMMMLAMTKPPTPLAPVRRAACGKPRLGAVPDPEARNHSGQPGHAPQGPR